MEQLKKAVQREAEELTAEAFSYIRLGYCPSWAEEHKQPGDEGIRRYCTAKRWEQYQNGEISRAQIVEYTQKRIANQNRKETEKKLNKIERIKNAPNVINIRITVNWVKSKTWGANPHVIIEAWTDQHTRIETAGTASGCGYDKRSAAIADAFNQNESILKALYIAEEKRLASTAEGDTSRRAVIGYGSGCNALPAFEGGCGVSCFRSIFENIGFNWKDAASGKAFDVYTITRKGEQ